jgi:hypothetical protein
MVICIFLGLHFRVTTPWEFEPPSHSDSLVLKLALEILGTFVDSFYGISVAILWNLCRTSVEVEFVPGLLPHHNGVEVDNSYRQPVRMSWSAGSSALSSTCVCLSHTDSHTHVLLLSTLEPADCDTWSCSRCGIDFYTIVVWTP